ncbi:MAG: hypothetical protein V1837_02180 [Candidatus Woesearchaeota archaeon]
MTEKFREQFLTVGKKFGLPQFEELNREFDIDHIEECAFPLRQIRIHISEYLEFYAKTIEDVLHPEPSISSLYELKNLSDKEKETLFIIYKELMKTLRYSLETGLKNTEADDARFIKETLAKWQQTKKTLLTLAQKLKESWDKEYINKEDLGYLG